MTIGPRLVFAALGSALGCALCALGLALATLSREDAEPPVAVPPLVSGGWHISLEQPRLDAFASVCARVESLPARRPFDRAQLRVAPAVTPGQELGRLGRMLADIESDVRDGDELPSGDADALARSLALFPWRFGVDPRTLDGWAPLAASAQRMLAAEDEARAVELAGEDSYAALFHAQLLDLAGRTSEADDALAKVEVHHFCGNCASGRQSVVDRRRSEAAERRGELASALELLEGSAHDRLAGWFHELTDDASSARYGLLLLQTGREADGRCVLQFVVELLPGTPGAEVARAALEQMGALREPTAERLQEAWVHGVRFDDPYRCAAERAEVHLANTGEISRLTALHAQGDPAALPALIELRDERTRPILEAALAAGGLPSPVPALEGLHALEGDAFPYVRPLLERMAVAPDAWTSLDTAELEAVLHRLCLGGPPRETSDQRRTAESLARAWLAWLDQRGL